MPKYLFQGSYRPEGTKGLLKEGASQRRTNLEALVKQQGGRLEAFYFTFGDADAVGIAAAGMLWLRRRRPAVRRRL